jgi:hypothetical protein
MHLLDADRHIEIDYSQRGIPGQVRGLVHFCTNDGTRQ